LQQSAPAPGSLKSQLLDFIMPSLHPSLLKGVAIRKHLQDLFDDMGDEDEGDDATLFNGKKIVKRQLAMLQSLRRNSNKKIIEEKIDPRQQQKTEQQKVETRRDS
jgi:hypothetical protein